MTAVAFRPSIVLESVAEGWMGTFALTVKFMLNDILSDGSPTTVRITVEEPDGSTRQLMPCEVIAVGNTNIILDSPTLVVEIESIRKLEI